MLREIRDIMVQKKYLLTPGPTPIPEAVLLEMASPICHHRTNAFRDVFREIKTYLQQVFRTQCDVFTVAASGTGAMEMAVVNSVSAQDEVLVIDGGKFSGRFAMIAKQYGAIVHTLTVEWGNSVEPERVREFLEKNKQIKAVFVALCETSTGVCFPVRDIAEIVRMTDALLVVDAISGLGADVLCMDDWGLDVVVSSSQKGLMTPPGLSFIALSDKAWARAEQATSPKFYFDLKKYRQAYGTDDTPFTPATTLVMALRKALTMIMAEGMENVYARHARLAFATRAAMNALGLTLFAARPSNAVTAVVMPEGINASQFVAKMRDDYGVVIAGGQGPVKAKVFRIAHLGNQTEFDILVGIAAIEKALMYFGYDFEIGAGIKRFHEICSVEQNEYSTV